MPCHLIVAKRMFFFLLIVHCNRLEYCWYVVQTPLIYDLFWVKNFLISISHKIFQG